MGTKTPYQADGNYDSAFKSLNMEYISDDYSNVQEMLIKTLFAKCYGVLLGKFGKAADLMNFTVCLFKQQMAAGRPYLRV